MIKWLFSNHLQQILYQCQRSELIRCPKYSETYCQKGQHRVPPNFNPYTLISDFLTTARSNHRPEDEKIRSGKSLKNLTSENYGHVILMCTG